MNFRRWNSCGLLTCLVVTFSEAIAAPNVVSVDISDSERWVVEGQSFGSGPVVKLYDDFSKLTGDEANLAAEPLIGEWYFFRTRHGGGEHLIEGDGLASGRSIAVRDSLEGGSVNLFFGVEDQNGVHGLEHFQEVYFSYSIRDAEEFPGPNGGLENFSDVSSTKDAWMMFGDRGDNTVYSVESLNEPAGHDLYIPGWTGSGFVIAGNQTSMSPSFGQSALRNNWVFGEWNTKMFYGRLDPDDPYGDANGYFDFINKNGYFQNDRNGNLMTDQAEEGVPYPYWDRIKFFAWLRTGDAEVRRLLDMVYVATGDNANARVIVTDSDSLHTSTMMVHLGPVDWQDDRIEIVPISFGGASSGARYLYVIDTNEQVSEPFPLGDFAPRSPSVTITID